MATASWPSPVAATQARFNLNDEPFFTSLDQDLVEIIATASRDCISFGPRTSIDASQNNHIVNCILSSDSWPMREGQQFLFMVSTWLFASMLYIILNENCAGGWRFFWDECQNYQLTGHGSESGGSPGSIGSLSLNRTKRHFVASKLTRQIDLSPSQTDAPANQTTQPINESISSLMDALSN